jgi:hypothetical protein
MDKDHILPTRFPNIGNLSDRCKLSSARLSTSLIMLIPLTVSLGTRAAAIIADLIVLVVTWYKTAGIVREAHLLGIRMPIGEIMFRDGEWSSTNDQLKLGANDVIFPTISTKRVGSLFFL